MLAPQAEVSMFPWKEPAERIPLAIRQIRSFLRAHRSGMWRLKQYETQYRPILTTHTGSLPRTAKVVELLLAEQKNPAHARPN